MNLGGHNKLKRCLFTAFVYLTLQDRDLIDASNIGLKYSMAKKKHLTCRSF